MKKILIIGDSWGSGEWDVIDGNYQVSHKGIEEYLRNDGHQVQNLSAGGSSLHDIYHSLINENYKDFDLVFCFITDPLRNFRPYGSHHLFFKKSITFENLVDAGNKELSNFYEKVNNLDITIYCIGGASHLNVDIIKNFKNLVPYIPSLSELLIPDYKHPVIWASDWLDYIDKIFNLTSLDKLLEYKRQQDWLWSDDAKEYFRPDGKHPNRAGHKILYDKIVKDFNL
jgi:hypothetical protein